jgi:phage/plasmid primase-like uncharacterized protein
MRAAGIDYRGPIVADGKLHRVHAEDDKKGVRNAWLLLHIDSRPAGAFGTWKGITSKWTAGLANPLTPEQRREFAKEMARKKAESEAAERERQATAAQMAQSMWAEAVDAVEHPYLARKGVPGYGVRVGDWVKESKPDEHGEIFTTRIKGALLIPLRDERKVIHSLQAVFAQPVKVRGEPRDKDFVYGGRKRGLWFSIGKPTEIDGALTIVICEGYATGASIHLATGLAVVVAFDAGNLLPVAQTVRRLMPKARIILAGDNDQWTQRASGEPWNVGLEKASEAAAAVDGICVVPRFPEGAEGKPTDFNDLHVLLGVEAVQRQLMAAIRPGPAPVVVDPAPEPAPRPPPTEEPPPHQVSPEGGDHGYVAEEDDDEGPDTASYFTIRGHDRESIFVYQHEMKMVVDRGLSDWSESALTMIAPLHWWEGEFPGEKGMNRKMAVNWLQRTAYKKGFFDPSKCRGRGAWQDAGRMVFHLGDQLMVDGAFTPLAKFKSNFVYEQGLRLREPAEDTMSAADGKKIVEIAKMFHWTRPASAILLAGWCALAPVCGALRWRPHVWLTGGAGSGKANPHSSVILTPEGWRKMGDLKVGDYVTTPDNDFAQILGKYPQGVQPVYKLTFADGRSARATGDHLWKVRIKDRWRLRTTDQMIEVLSRGSRQSVKLAVPLADPLTIEGNNKTDLLMHPYVLGVLLGDGSLGNEYGSDRTGDITLTSFDPEIVERVRQHIPEWMGLSPRSLREGAFRFHDLSRYGRRTRELIKDLRLLGTRSDTKFIPDTYLRASIEDRWELLKGLMDTDGTVCERGSMSYCTISPRLRDDVITLVRSLGGVASYTHKYPTFTYKGEKRDGQVAFTINIRLRDRSRAFSLSRKIARCDGPYQYEDCLYLNVKSIVLDGEEECSCIAIDHPDRLYVTDDFVVTHNTTVMDQFVSYLMGGMEIHAQGNSTEAGIRQTLRSDALPVLFDESEQNNEREAARIQGILALIRQSSTESGARTLKGSATGDPMGFLIRSMFCLASIQVGMKQQADLERLTVLALRSKKKDALDGARASETWAKLSAALGDLRADQELPMRLLRRSLDLLPTTVRNIEIFAQAAAEKFGSQREGDQFGAMLAGAWSLVSTKLATIEDARAMIDRYDWSEYTEDTETEESTKALSALLGSKIRVKNGIEVTVYELVAAAAGKPLESYDVAAKEADAVLRRYGMMIKWTDRYAENAALLVANTSIELQRLLEGTPYVADLKGQLARVPNAFKEDPASFNGTKSRSVGIPLATILEGLRQPDAGADFEIDDEIAF